MCLYVALYLGKYFRVCKLAQISVTIWMMIFFIWDAHISDFNALRNSLTIYFLTSSIFGEINKKSQKKYEQQRRKTLWTIFWLAAFYGVSWERSKVIVNWFPCCKFWTGFPKFLSNNSIYLSCNLLSYFSNKIFFYYMM